MFGIWMIQEKLYDTHVLRIIGNFEGLANSAVSMRGIRNLEYNISYIPDVHKIVENLINLETKNSQSLTLFRSLNTRQIRSICIGLNQRTICFRGPYLLRSLILKYKVGFNDESMPGSNSVWGISITLGKRSSRQCAPWNCHFLFYLVKLNNFFSVQHREKAGTFKLVQGKTEEKEVMSFAIDPKRTCCCILIEITSLIALRVWIKTDGSKKTSINMDQFSSPTSK